MRNFKNVIYILTNPMYAGYVKIGYAADLYSRIASLNTGMLRNYDVYAVYETPVPLADKQFHLLIDDLAPIVRARVVAGQKVQDKEFFKLEPEQAYDLFQHIAKMTGTEDRLHLKDEPEIISATKSENISVKKRNTRTTSEYPVTYGIQNKYYPFVSWVKTTIAHCNTIIEEYGFDEFKKNALQIRFSNKATKRKIFAETEAEMRGFTCHCFEENSLYMLTNYNADCLRKINEKLDACFPKCQLGYIYKN